MSHFTVFQLFVVVDK